MHNKHPGGLNFNRIWMQIICLKIVDKNQPSRLGTHSTHVLQFEDIL